MMNESKIKDLGNAANIIRDAIVRSRYQAAKLVNKELLSLYYGVGKYVSDHSRTGFWGQGAIKRISERLQRELPGLRGFSEGSLKKMRLFYEEWSVIFSNRSLTTNDSEPVQKTEPTEEAIALSVSPLMSDIPIDLGLLLRHLGSFETPGLFMDEFLRVGFTHQYTIISKEKSLPGRLFYIAKSATEFWSVEALKTHLRGDLFSKTGSLPSNFLQTLPEMELARRAIRSFKDEYFLDYINIEDENDPDERVLENEIVANIKKFIMSFGSTFCYMGNQYRVVVDDREYFIDLLFFNRELHCLVAIELKRGSFKPSQLGQLYFYLTALDDYVRRPDENPSIGIILCKEARRSTAEYAIRDYNKPMGVATYKTRNDMPAPWRNALPDIEEMRKLLDAAPDEQDEADE
jgi:predicted nuclease of restriction endonuclease-like (RecB) superfamily